MNEMLAGLKGAGSVTMMDGRVSLRKRKRSRTKSKRRQLGKTEGYFRHKQYQETDMVAIQVAPHGCAM